MPATVQYASANGMNISTVPAADQFKNRTPSVAVF
jgi:hypothetical protein